MTLAERIVKLKETVDQAAEEATKVDGGNKAAGTRLRGLMQDVKNASQEIRKAVLEVRKGDR